MIKIDFKFNSVNLEMNTYLIYYHILLIYNLKFFKILPLRFESLTCQAFTNLYQVRNNDFKKCS